MFRNYFKIAIRNFLKNKVYSLINITGLALGIASSVLIGLYVINEFSYDKFNKTSDLIYRVTSEGTIEDNKITNSTSPFPLAETISNEYPEVRYATTLFDANQAHKFPTVKTIIGNNSYFEKRFFFADTNFFKVFNIKMRSGNYKTALADPSSIVLTETTAKKYFGDKNPIGKIITIPVLGKNFVYKVTGISENVPENSHFHYDLLCSIYSINNWPMDMRKHVWLEPIFYTYVMLREGADPVNFENKLKGVFKKHVEPILGTASNDRTRKTEFAFHLQPLTSIHLHSHFMKEIEPNGEALYTYIFIIAGVFILIIACINYINLSTARYSVRSKEVGLRKTFGAERIKIIKQFLVESIILSMLSLILAMLIIEIMLPIFNQSFNLHIKIEYLKDIYIVPSLMFLSILVGIAAGLYPAYFLSSFQPVSILKDKFNSNHKRSLIRNILVIFQFSLSIIIVLSTYVVFNQLKYIQNKNLGFDKENILVLDEIYKLGPENMNSFLNELERCPSVLSYTASNGVPGKILFTPQSYRIEGTTSSDLLEIPSFAAVENFAKTYGIQVLQGSDFTNTTPQFSALLNETAVKMLGLKDPIGKKIYTDNGSKGTFTATVSGVLKDFHYTSLHHSIGPFMVIRWDRWSHLSLRVAGGQVTETLSFLNQQWRKFIPGSEPLSFYFLDEVFNRQYKSEIQTRSILTAFSIISIAIACLGLFSLTSYITEKRVKEVGIRKVLGASIINILVMLTKEIIIWVLIANIIAWPITYYAMNKWLQDFAYKIEINWWMFALTGGAALLTAFVTVSFQAIKAATANPVESLKYE